MFDEMISKSLIQWIWIGWSGLIGIAGLLALIQADGLGGALVVVIAIVLGLMFARVVCESLIVIFMMHENLHRSRVALEEMERRQSAMASMPPTQTRMSGTEFTEMPQRSSRTSTSGSTPAPKTLRPMQRSGLENTSSSSEPATGSRAPEQSKSRLGEWPTPRS